MKKSEIPFHKTASENLNIESVKEVRTEKKKRERERESILYDFTQMKLKNRQNCDRG